MRVETFVPGRLVGFGDVTPFESLPGGDLSILNYLGFEIGAFLGFYAASNYIFLLTFRDNLPAPRAA
jgi:hypothetical protein